MTELNLAASLAFSLSRKKVSYIVYDLDKKDLVYTHLTFFAAIPENIEACRFVGLVHALAEAKNQDFMALQTKVFSNSAYFFEKKSGIFPTLASPKDEELLDLANRANNWLLQNPFWWDSVHRPNNSIFLPSFLEL